MKKISMSHGPALGAALFLVAGNPASGRILQVGPGKTYTKPSQVASLVKDGDTVEFDPGVYPGDAATWRANNLLLRGTAPYAHIRADGAQSAGKGLWVLSGKNTTIENMEFSGAKVPDMNGAGIRADADGLIVRKCYFHDNENGILGGGGSSSHVVIENSEFASNGNGDGLTHNIYISRVASFTLKFSNSRLARIGHLVKSRAAVNHILYNRIMDEAAGTSSYQVNLPNGGAAYVIGNAIQQGPGNDNPIFISYGEEGMNNPGKDLYVINNTMVNDAGSGTFVSMAGGTSLKMWNNLLVGPGRAFSGSADTGRNLATSNPAFVDRAGFDFRLTAVSPAVDGGADPGTANGVPLAPAFEYRGNIAGSTRPVAGALDVGAFEFVGSGSISFRPEEGLCANPRLLLLSAPRGNVPGLDVLARNRPLRSAGVAFLLPAR